MDRKTLVLAAGFAALLFLSVVFFPNVKAPDIKGGFVASQTDAEKALDAGELDKQTARDVLALKRAGLHVTLAELDAASHDAPGNRLYGALAEIDQPKFEVLYPRDADHEPHRALCFAIQREGGVSHDIFYYNAANAYDMGDLGLYAWIRSGCAAAIKASTQSQLRSQYLARIMALVPKDPSYDTERSAIGGNLYMVCREETRQNLKGLTGPQRVTVDMRDSQRCQRLSGQ